MALAGGVPQIDGKPSTRVEAANNSWPKGSDWDNRVESGFTI